jgi:aldose 1-epimerase
MVNKRYHIVDPTDRRIFVASFPRGTSVLLSALLALLCFYTVFLLPVEKFEASADMLFPSLSTFAAVSSLLQATASGQATGTSSSPFTIYTITANDITAKFIPYGARLTSLLVPDRNGVEQDVVAGYDTGERYLQDTETNHTYFGPVVGRFANRVRNSTFTIDGVAYHIPANENGGEDTLHGGTVGYDQRNWTVASHNDSSISFTLLDTAFEGFPGTVLTTASFSVSAERSGPQGQLRPRLTSNMVSVALDAATPIMLANHIYWNLNGFKEATVLNDTTVWMPYADRYIEVDTILIREYPSAPSNRGFSLTPTNSDRRYRDDLVCSSP